jgi:hypothetical protein
MLWSVLVLQLPNEPAKPMGHGMLSYSRLDYNTLVEMR